MVSDIKNKDKRELFKNYDSIVYEAGGTYIDNLSKKMLSEPHGISNKLSEKIFCDLLNTLYDENNNPHKRKLDNGNNKCDKCRQLKFFEKSIMFYYYKEKIPVNLLEKK